MPYIADRAEASGMVGKPLCGPVYKSVGTDGEGNEIAVPVFKISKEGGGKMRKRLRDILLSCTGIIIGTAIIWLIIILLMTVEVDASAPGHERIEQTESQAVIELTEQITEIYPVCPELIQALIFYESGNQRAVVSRWGDVGYMQINPKWMRDRMDKLGITDLKDGYSNVLVGTDYLYELFTEYEEPELVLMAYNVGKDKAVRLYEAGKISDYARNILELAEDLERFHGK